MGLLIDKILKMQSANILVLGDAMLDTYVEGEVSRISPEAPVPILLVQNERSVIGGAANVAANIANFGAEVFLITRIAHDENGEKILSLCQNNNINTNYIIKENDYKTIEKKRILSGYQQIVRIDKEQIKPLHENTNKQVITFVYDFINNHKINSAIIISDYAKGFFSDYLLQQIITIANDNNVPIIVDPKSINISKYKGATYIKPNLHDIKEIMKIYKPEKSSIDIINYALEGAKIYANNADIANIVISMSDKGLLFYGKNNNYQVEHLASKALKVADVSGAGDTLVSFLALGVAINCPILINLEIANIAAGIVCGKLGTATVTCNEIIEQILQEENVYNESSKIITKEQAKIIAMGLKKLNKKIVFTNGCFDILHAGHVTLLEKARALGDILFIGLNSDLSIKRLKGEKRPIQNELDRAKIIASLGVCSYLVIFSEDTPLDLINILEPDILVKGGDYLKTEIIGYNEVIKRGGQVVIVPLVDGKSTTCIINKTNMNE